MTKNTKSQTHEVLGKPRPTKHQQVVEMLQRDDGTTVEELLVLANWLPHSTRAFMTGLKKKGFIVDSEKADGIRRYRIVPAGRV